MGKLSWETDAGEQVTEETVWVKTQSRGGPTASRLVPNCPSSPWMGKLRFWKSTLLAADEEAIQTNNFKKDKHQRKFKRSGSLLPYQTFYGDSNFHKKKRRKRVAGVTIPRVGALPRSHRSPRSSQFPLSSTCVCRGMINSHQSCIRTSII